MKTSLAAILLLCLSISTTFAYPSGLKSNRGIQEGTSLLTIAKNFLKAKENSYQLSATQADVDAVLNFCSDSIQYDHVLSPDKKFSFSGKDMWRSGAISHLGETRNVRLQITNSIGRQNVVIVKYDLIREVKDTVWKSSKTTTVSIIEFDKNGKIKKITDYL